MCQPDAMRLKYETKLAPIAVKAPRAALGSYLDPRLIVP
jgi:hypothetical protein